MGVPSSINLYAKHHATSVAQIAIPEFCHKRHCTSQPFETTYDRSFEVNADRRMPSNTKHSHFMHHLYNVHAVPHLEINIYCVGKRLTTRPLQQQLQILYHKGKILRNAPTLYSLSTSCYQ